MQIELRPAVTEDYAFAYELYQREMRWIIERLFGWDQAREDASFASQFTCDEAEIIVIDGERAGWLQTQRGADALNLGQLYVITRLQNRGIGTAIIEMISARARDVSVTLAVVKINPAVRLYERCGFRILREDPYKFYMQRDPA